ncbi:MAG: carboxyl transferase domain-containing protein [Microbacterium sp.]
MRARAGPTVVVGGSFGAGTYSMCGRRIRRGSCGCGRVRVSVMGGPQAASVLPRCAASSWMPRARPGPTTTEVPSKRSIRAQYEEQGNPYYSTARLWDDGVIEPAQTRDVLGLALDVVSRAPMEGVGYGVFRM